LAATLDDLMKVLVKAQGKSRVKLRSLERLPQ
jgi:hypothetical protein